MLGPTQADTGRTEGNRIGGLLGRIGIGAHLKPRHLAAPIHELSEHLVGGTFASIQRFLNQDLHNLRSSGGKLTGVYFAGGAVDRNVIAFLIHTPVHRHRSCAIIDLERAGTTNTNFTHLPRHQGGMRTNATFSRQDTLGGNHASQVLRRGLVSH